ncbi:MAG: SRPBCC family protein, partial [Dehalococcoidia bacterium]
WGLVKVPKVTNFHGMIFANFDPEAPTLEKWLGEDGCWWLENFILAGPLGGLEALPGWHRYWSPGNWKHLAENFIGDDYHVGAATHVSWFKVVGEMAKEGRLDWRKAYPAAERQAFEATLGYTSGCPIGLGMVDLGDSTYEVDLKHAAELGKESLEWVKERHHRLDELLQDREEKPYGFMNGAIFPNLGLMGFGSPLVGRHFPLFQPRGPWEMEQWQWTMVEKEAPAAVKELAAQRVYQGQHMAGGIAPDDVENLERIVETMRSPRNWKLPHNYTLQLGHEAEGPTSLPGHFGPNPSEVNQRQFYRFWLELMEVE